MIDIITNITTLVLTSQKFSSCSIAVGVITQLWDSRFRGDSAIGDLPGYHITYMLHSIVSHYSGRRYSPIGRKEDLHAASQRRFSDELTPCQAKALDD